MDSPQVGNWSEGMFKFVVIISYYKIEFLPQLFGRRGEGRGEGRDVSFIFVN